MLGFVVVRFVEGYMEVVEIHTDKGDADLACYCLNYEWGDNSFSVQAAPLRSCEEGGLW